MGFFSNMFGSKKYTNINNDDFQNIIKNSVLNGNVLFQNGKLLHNNVFFAKNVPQFIQHSAIQAAVGTSSLLGIGKVNHRLTLTGEHIEDRPDL